MRALSRDPAWHLFALWLRDRFGDYGLTGVAFCVDRDGESEIDTLLLSCRVLGRGVETALAGVLIDQARSRGQRRLTGRFIPTAKNDLAADYYPSQGFTQVNGIFVYETAKPFPIPSHIALDLVGLEDRRAPDDGKAFSPAELNRPELEQVVNL